MSNNLKPKFEFAGSYGYDKDEVDNLIAEKDKEIDRLSIRNSNMNNNEEETLVQAALEEAGIWTRMFEHGLHPKLSTWVYLDKGKPTVDIGIQLLTKDDQCVGMYHLTDRRILVSNIGFGPGGTVGLSQFAHHMTECMNADDLFDKIPKLLSAQKVAQQEVEIFKKDMMG